MKTEERQTLSRDNAPPVIESFEIRFPDGTVVSGEWIPGGKSTLRSGKGALS